MRNRFVGLILAVVGILAVLPVVFAQTAPQRRAATVQPASPAPDLSGVWATSGESRGVQGGRTVGRRGGARFEGIPAMTPAGAAKYKAYADAIKERADNRSLFDPMITSCAPPGPTRIMQQGRSFEMIQAPDRMILLYETDHWVRHVWMDGRKHAAEPDHTWMGHSIGWWEGDTLVVDTVGLNEYTWLNNNGYPHSEALHIVERFRRVSPDTLEVAVVYEDPPMYTKPWVGKITYLLERDGEVLESVSCEDRIRNQMKKDPCESGAWELEILCEERRQPPKK